MKKLNTNDVLDRANAIYAAQVAGELGVGIAYAAPETLPRIESRQVKAVAAALVDEINLRLGALGHWEE